MTPEAINDLIHERLVAHDIEDDNIIIPPLTDGERKAQIVDQDDPTEHKAWLTWVIGKKIHFVLNCYYGGIIQKVIARYEDPDVMRSNIDIAIDCLTIELDEDYSD